MTSPSPFWYLGRGLGTVLLLTLTAAVVLGILTSRRWKTEGWPYFATTVLHRNLAILSVVLLPLHGLAMVADSYAHLGILDITVPFLSRYRPVWLGLGVLSGEILIAVVLTSLLRARLGYRLWRAVHWATYPSWLLGLLHGLGTGSDTRAPWALFFYVLCAGAVLLAVFWRLSVGAPEPSGWRAAFGGASLAGAAALALWVFAGPLQPGWAARAGTPVNLIGSRQASGAGTPTPRSTPTPATLPAGLDDQVQGSATEGEQGTVLRLTDVRDPSIVITIGVAGETATSGPMRVTSRGRTVCATQASFDQGVVGTCGTVQVQLALSAGDDGALTGRLVTVKR